MDSPLSLSLSLSLHGCLSLCLFDRVSFVCVSSTEYSILPSHLHCHYSSISVSTSIRIIVLVIASTLRLLNSGEGTKKNPQKQPAALSLSLPLPTTLPPSLSSTLPLNHTQLQKIKNKKIHPPINYTLLILSLSTVFFFFFCVCLGYSLLVSFALKATWTSLRCWRARCRQVCFFNCSLFYSILSLF